MVTEVLSPVPWTHEVMVGPGDQVPLADPTAAYLASLSPAGRETMIKRLKAVAKLIGVPYEAVAWHQLRFVHLDFIRQRLIERGAAPATVNQDLSPVLALRR